MKEFIHEIDWNDNVIGTFNKLELKKRTFIHRASLIIPKTNDNKFILSKRSINKHPFPGVWCCAIGGKVLANESYEEGAKREMKEEVDFVSELQFVTQTKMDNEKEKAIYNIFTTKGNLDVNNFNPDPSEIDGFGVFSLDEISNMIKENPENFAPAFRIAMKEFVKEFKF